jgi:hypothetical protein
MRMTYRHITSTLRSILKYATRANAKGQGAMAPCRPKSPQYSKIHTISPSSTTRISVLMLVLSKWRVAPRVTASSPDTRPPRLALMMVELRLGGLAEGPG